VLQTRPVTHVSGWRVVVPVKGGAEAKTRLALEPGARRALATAMALDALTAAVQTPGVGLVVCVTADPEVADAARATGAVTVSPRAPGLAPAIDAGLFGLDHGPTAVLLGDLPALRPDDLEDALAQALTRHGPSLVTDAEGTGSVLLADVEGSLPHRFGPDSARRHREAGARELTDAFPSLRRDVDTLDDLTAALALGVGAHTLAQRLTVSIGDQ